MRTVLLALALCAAFLAASAGGKPPVDHAAAPASASAQISSWAKTCAQYSAMAKIMELARQAGVPMSDSIDVVDKNAPPGDFRKLQERMVIEAYQVPRFTEKDLQTREVDDFGDQVYEECAQTLGPH